MTTEKKTIKAKVGVLERPPKFRPQFSQASA